MFGFFSSIKKSMSYSGKKKEKKKEEIIDVKQMIISNDGQ